MTPTQCCSCMNDKKIKYPVSMDQRAIVGRDARMRCENSGSGAPAVRLDSFDDRRDSARSATLKRLSAYMGPAIRALQVLSVRTSW